MEQFSEFVVMHQKIVFCMVNVWYIRIPCKWLGVQKNSQSICDKTLFSIAQGGYWDCCSCYWHRWADQGCLKHFLLVKYLLIFSSLMVWLSNDNFYRHLTGMRKWYATLWILQNIATKRSVVSQPLILKFLWMVFYIFDVP